MLYMAIPEKYQHIDFRPTEAMAANAKRALERRAEVPPSKRGMTDTGIARARDISNRVTLSPETVREMNGWFARHTSTSRNSPNYNDRFEAWQAWNGWGGDSGRVWVAARIRQMDAADKVNKAIQGLSELI